MSLLEFYVTLWLLTSAGWFIAYSTDGNHFIDDIPILFIVSAFVGFFWPLSLPALIVFVIMEF